MADFIPHPVQFKGSRLALGTRSFTPGWRSGFYQVALGAQVPLALVKLDWGKRCFSVVDFYELSGQVDKDDGHMAQVFQGVEGFHVDQMGPIAPWSPQAASKAFVKPSANSS